MADRIAGVVFVKADGIQMSVAGSVTSSPFGEEREMLVGLSGPVGYKEMPRVPFLEVEIYDDAGTDLEALHALTDATVQAELANGKTHIYRNATSVTPPELNVSEGTTTMRWEALGAEIG